MSSIYIQEPPTSGKVVMNTSVGDIEIELWCKEAPKTCRNFIQLCMEGYYNSTIFHRIVKGFIAQGGDPTKTGKGGESIYGHPFKDEFHSRLRFVRRGLLAMANSGEPNDNRSQFFFTFEAAPELQNKNTIFGKVVGNTLYNMLKLNDTIVDEDDRPTYPPKIISVDVITKYFDDIVPRAPKPKEKEKTEDKKSKVVGTKNFNLLSFGDEAEEEEELNIKEVRKMSGRGKSSHDLTDDPKLSKDTVKLDEDTDAVSVKPGEVGRNSSVAAEDERSKSKESSQKAEDELSSIRSKLKKTNKPPVVPVKPTSAKEEKKLRKEAVLKEYEKEMAKYKQASRTIPAKGAAREMQTLSVLSNFRQKQQEAREKKNAGEKLNEFEEFLTHTLKFETDDPVLAKDANTKGDDWFEIFDPRNALNKRRREAGVQDSGPKRKSAKGGK